MEAPRRILECGPGTGAVTAEIVRQLRPGDQLDILEINGDHPVIRRLAAAVGKDGAVETVNEAALLLLDQARLLEGEPVPDMTAFARRMTAMLGRGVGP